MTNESARIQPPPLQTLDAAQLALLERTLRVLGAPVGPRMILLHNVELAERWAALGDALKESSFSARVRELAILCVAQYWRARFEWHAHARNAEREGIPMGVIEALRGGAVPQFTDATDAAVYAYCAELQHARAVSDTTYQQAWHLLGTRGLVDLTALVGHYTSVAMTLVAHNVPLPEGVEDPFPISSLHS